MDIAGWDARYASRERAAEDLHAPANPLLLRIAEGLVPGRALDLACGTGRNALWLAEHGWEVTAVDGAANAIDVLRENATERGLSVNAIVADLESNSFRIEPQAYDLIVILFYLQRNLFELAKAGLKPGGILVTIAHTIQGTEQPTNHRLSLGELEGLFRDWEIVHYREGKSQDQAHKRPVAEIVARNPL